MIWLNMGAGFLAHSVVSYPRFRVDLLSVMGYLRLRLRRRLMSYRTDRVSARQAAAAARDDVAASNRA